ncbi:MAG: GlsB/YeaQ/YmgE family stress response membrane protein [Nocardioides sp.]
MIITTIAPMALGVCKSPWSLGGLILLLIGGIIIGLLGKFLAPGSRDNTPLWLTVLCGIVGILLGNWLYVDVFNGKCATSGVDWLRHIVQIITAAILVVIAATATGRNRRA